MARLLYSLLFLGAVASGYLLVPHATNEFVGDYLCENFGLPTTAYRRLHVDGDLSVSGELGPGRRQPVGRLEPRGDGLAYFDLAKETLTWRGSTLDPLAQYIVDDANDALLILEVQGQRAVRAFVCRRR